MYHFAIFKPEIILISISEIEIKIEKSYFDIISASIMENIIIRCCSKVSL